MRYTSIVALTLIACSPDEAPPDVVLAANAAGHFSAGLETTSVMTGLATEFPTDAPADEAVEAAAATLDDLLGSCADFDAETGDTTSLSLDFGEDGCSFLETPLFFYGSVSYSTTEDGLVETWTVTFDQLQLGGVTIDGAVTVTQLAGLTAGIDLDALTVSYDDTTVSLSATGGLQTTSSHMEVVFSASGEVTWSDRVWSFDADSVSRQLATDCYPESGTITVDFIDDDGVDQSAVVTFVDGQLQLDSDDSGEVEVSMGGIDYVVQLPPRACVGF